MLYEYRRYEAMPGRLRDVHKRFEEVAVKVWQRLGIEPVGFWEPAVGTSNELHYLLRWSDMGDREKRWSTFLADPEWREGFAKSETNGTLVARIHNQFWYSTSYSPLK
jgi:hypothetical protein